MLTIRRYHPGEEKALWQLFYHTIKHINIRDYSQTQVDAWAGEGYDESYWQARISKINPFVVLLNNEIVAYGDVQSNGHVDHFFCHHQHQGKGIGAFLLEHLTHEARALGCERMWMDASETAKPFFEKHGFAMLKAQTPVIRGVTLSNYKMEKRLD